MASVLDAASTLADDIDRQKRGLKSGGGAAARGRLLEAAERLVNLLTLVMHRSGELRAAFAQPAQEQVTHLRGRLLGSSRELIVQRADRVRRRALSGLDGRNGYPLGLARRLRESLSAIEGTLQVLGGAAVLSSDDRAILEAAAQAVARLVDFEATLMLEVA